MNAARPPAVSVFTPSAQDLRFIADALADASFNANYQERRSTAAMRAGTAALTTLDTMRRVPAGVVVEPVDIAGVACEWLRPRAVQGDGTLLYLHGGGFIRGSLELGRANAAQLALAAAQPVLAIGYRQAPEHPYPAAPQDVRVVYDALLARGVPAGSLVVVGESSGGCLALSLVVQLTQAGVALPAGVAALSPMADLRLRGASWHYNAGRDVADLETGRRMVALYMGAASLDDPVASPVMHHWRGSCPLLLAAATHETMLSDIERVATRATEAGADVSLHLHLDLPHGFTRFATPAATRALDEAAAWCVRRLRAAPREPGRN